MTKKKDELVEDLNKVKEKSGLLRNCGNIIKHLLHKARCHRLPLNYNRNRFSTWPKNTPLAAQHPFCPHCYPLQTENAYHYFFICPKYNKPRKSLMDAQAELRRTYTTAATPESSLTSLLHPSTHRVDTLYQILDYMQQTSRFTKAAQIPTTPPKPPKIHAFP